MAPWCGPISQIDSSHPPPIAVIYNIINRLTRDITLDDLEPEDHYILESGCMQISNKLKDAYGRHLYIGFPNLRPFESPSEAMVSQISCSDTQRKK